MSLNNEESDGLKAFLAGCFSGVIFIAAGHPFDTVKVRMQNQLRGELYKGSVDCLRKTVKFEGSRALFKGMSVPLAAGIPSTAMYFLGYNNGITLQKMFLGEDHDMNVYNKGIAGAFGGLYWTLTMVPGDRVKCLLQVQNSQKKRKGPLDILVNSYRHGGIREVFRGTLIMAIRDVPAAAVFFMVYDSLIRQYEIEQRGALSALLVTGGLAGVSQWLFNAIPDVVKTRYQSAPLGRYKSFMDVIPELYKAEGLAAFFKGFAPSGLRAFVANGICIVSYEGFVFTYDYFRKFRFHTFRYHTSAKESR